jgi:oligosaccharide repeat unit polymerase
MIEGVELVFSLILLVWLFARYQRARWVIFLWLGIVAAQTVIGGGSRTMLMVMLAASAMLYHRFVRPISVMAAVSGAALIFVAFMTLGVVRQTRGRVDAAPFSFGVSAGEFESMFANAVDLEERKQRHEFDIMTPRLYASEIAAAIPSQVLPFQKLDLSAWYLATFYPVFGDSGGGFAFGIVPQAIVGFGVLELILRGALVGYIFARLHRWYRRRNASSWVLIVYLWVVVLAYQSFRNVMTYPLSLFLQHFVPAMLLTLAAKQLIEGAIPGRRGSVQPIATS